MSLYGLSGVCSPLGSILTSPCVPSQSLLRLSVWNVGAGAIVPRYWSPNLSTGNVCLLMQQYKQTCSKTIKHQSLDVDERYAASCVTEAFGSFEQKRQWPSACEVVSLVHQSLLHSIVSHENNRLLPAQVQSHHRPIGLAQLEKGAHV